MDNVFHTQLDLSVLADAITPLIAERLGLEYGSKAGSHIARPAANEPDDWPSEPATADSEADPWSDDPPARERRSPARSAPRGGNSGRQQSGNSRPARGGGRSAPCANASGWPESGTETDRFDRTWYFGESDAPDCKGGHQAAMVDGTSQSGKDYRVWACPAGFGKTYKQKCDFWEFTD